MGSSSCYTPQQPKRIYVSRIEEVNPWGEATNIELTLRTVSEYLDAFTRTLLWGFGMAAARSFEKFHNFEHIGIKRLTNAEYFIRRDI